MKNLLILLLLSLTLSCSKEDIEETQCNVMIKVINIYTGELVAVSYDNYQMLYELYIKQDNGCNDLILDYGNYTIIYTTVNYPPTPEAMGWASGVTDSPNGNASSRFCLYSDCIPKPKLIKIYNFIFKSQIFLSLTSHPRKSDEWVLRSFL